MSVKIKQLFVIICLTVFSSITAQVNWRNIGPGGGSDLQTILIQPDNADILYVGGDIEGLFKSTNGGVDWNSLNSNLATGPWTPDVYWTNQFSYDLSDNTYNTIFYCSAVAMFKTTDGGNNWELLFPSAINTEDDFITVQSMAQNPNDYANLFVGTDGKGFHKSDDGGVTWTKVSVPMADSANVFGAVVTANSEIILGTSDGVYYSPDLGSTWVNRTAGLPHNYVWNLKYVSGDIFVTLPTFGTQGNAGTFSGGFYKSSDMGQTWIDLNSNLPKMQSDGMFYYYWKFTVNLLNPNTIYIGTAVGYPDETLAAFEDWGVYKSIDGGVSWQRNDLNLTPGWMDETFFDERHALLLAIAPSDTNTIYWGRDWMNKTTDGGNTWKQIYTNKVGNAWKGNGFELMMTETMSFSPNDPNKIFIGYDDMGPFRSDDGANSFIPLDPQMDPFDGYDAAKVICIDPDNNDLYIARYDGIGSAFTNGYTMGKIYFSNDDGNTQTEISTGFPDGRPDLAVDFTSGSAGNRTMYATSFTNGVYKSTNSGGNWTAINNGLGADAAGAWVIRINPNNISELYLGINNFGAGGALYKSTDSGANWSAVTSFPALDVLSLEFDKTNNIIYCGATENYDWSVAGGLYKSTDDGNSWTQISDLPRVADIAINPDNPDILFIVSQPWYAVWLPDVKPGILKSTDAGNTWQDITNNLNHAYVLFAELNPNNTSQLFIGTGGGGLWVADNVTAVEEEKEQLPTSFSLSQNYPNPFNPTTTIKYSIPAVVATQPNGGGSNLSNSSQRQQIAYLTARQASSQAPRNDALVQLKIYDILGREIATLVNEYKSPGNYEATFNADNLPSGVYIYRLTSGSKVKARKMILIK